LKLKKIEQIERCNSTKTLRLMKDKKIRLKLATFSPILIMHGLYVSSESSTSCSDSSWNKNRISFYCSIQN